MYISTAETLLIQDDIPEHSFCCRTMGWFNQTPKPNCLANHILFVFRD